MNNPTGYDFSINVLEPAVVEAFNNRYYRNGKGRHAVQLCAPLVGKYKSDEGKMLNAYDCILHRDFQVTNFETGQITFFDVKYQDGKYLNFSISKSCENINTLDFFALVYINTCYICKYEDVINNLFPSRKPDEFNLISLKTVQKIKIDSFTVKM